jgi:hypothetical protein
MKKLCWLMVVCLCLTAVSVWAASEESARAAVAKTFPEASFSQSAAIFQLLAALKDGDTVSIMLNGAGATFHVKDDKIVIGGKPQTPGAPAATTKPATDTPAKPLTIAPPVAETYKSAVAYRVTTRPVALDPLQAELERNSYQIIGTTDNTISFMMATRGTMVTVTTDGIVCLCSPRALDSFVTVDQLENEATKTMNYMRASGAGITLGVRDGSYYSAPAHIYKYVAFSGQSPKEQRMSAYFKALLQIPQIAAKAARIQTWYPHRRDVYLDVNWVAPTVLIDGHKVIKPRPTKFYYAADVTEILTTGDHTLSLDVPNHRDETTGSEFIIDMLLPAGNQADIAAVVRGETITGCSSQPMTRIGEDWETLAEALQ